MAQEYRLVTPAGVKVREITMNALARLGFASHVGGMTPEEHQRNWDSWMADASEPDPGAHYIPFESTDPTTPDAEQQSPPDVP